MFESGVRRSNQSDSTGLEAIGMQMSSKPWELIGPLGVCVDREKKKGPIQIKL